MTNHELERTIKALISKERHLTVDILSLINLAAERRLHLERGFSTLFDWLTTGLGYSAAAAHRRLESARLIKVVPQAEEKLANGVLNLTNLAKARTSIRAHEKATGESMSAAKQAEIVSAVERKTTAEAELALLELLPETAVIINQERTKRINQTESRVTIKLHNDDLANLAWIKDYLSHAMPDATTGRILSRIMEEYVQRKSTSAAEVTRLKAERRTCEFRDEVTGKVCGSTKRVEVDHIIPKALGGTDDPANLRCLCRTHNLYMAERGLGRRWANAWRRA